jgi:transglutaminase-like putative cysteine protease
VERFFQYALLGMLASGYAAVWMAGALDAASASLAGAALLVRLAMVSGFLAWRVGERGAAVMALAYIGFYPIDYFWISGGFLAATVHLVFFLASVLVLKADTARDYALLMLMSFLEILAASVVSFNIGFLAFLAVYVLSGLAALTAGEMRGQMQRQDVTAPPMPAGMRRSLTALSMTTFVAVAVMACGLFILLPRTARAALEQFVPQRYHLPGFSNEVLLGQIGEIKMMSTPVMHTRLYNPVRPSELKWRGATLAQFDGRRWFNASDRGETVRVEKRHARLADSRQQSRFGRRIFYEVSLKSATSDALFFLGTPELVQIDVPRLIRTSGGGYRLGSPASGLRYAGYSFLEDRLHGPPSPIELPPEARTAYLRTPPIDPRVLRLTEQVFAPHTSLAEKAAALETHLRSSYGYSVSLAEKEPRDPVAYFLFERKEGHCEYFASAMAVMLRTQGIPSRIVTGFQGGAYNPITGWYLVRASDAHSWVEAFIDGIGWLTFDPTPPDPRPQSANWMDQVQMYLDAAEVFWQDWVMSYDLERQVLLADRMGRTGRWFDPEPARWASAWRELRAGIDPWLLMALAAAVCGVAVAWKTSPKWLAWWRWRRRVKRVEMGEAEVSDATLLYLRMLELLRARGLERPAWMTPREFAMSPAVWERAPIAREITDAYQQLRFGGRLDAAARLADLVGQLEKSKAEKP